MFVGKNLIERGYGCYFVHAGMGVGLQLLTPFLGTCLGWQDKVAVRCLQSGLPMRMVADEGEVERD